jgi:hypothetical protein
MQSYVCGKLLRSAYDYWLLQRGGIVKSVQCTMAIFRFVMRPHLSPNYS